ncbi:PQQ-dependent sugar dehydrogenase [Alkalilimnicola ehrlichii MLHE-1]|uniref:Glucose sorbosone dehydrogenase n=1 Tax=Alkalilimnicola ehrlichii (strain ATCC BAA-1101 / DSM 17681 / MLHE-1) TaxID=187272 RepID=Q0ABL6_ALKEH|nr:PQQ-dependent sugar dehydrogenase [Alkalilimnicola ehrlichii]ABI55771.1 glucose sorbosone dehydrogenase [Alkalilimnicola ehrlichii MLHE-1]
MCRSSTLILIGLGFTALTAPTLAPATDVENSQHHRFEIERLGQGFSHPWGLAFLPDGDLLVTERPGRLQRVDAGTGERRRIEGTPDVAATGQGGMLDIALHPDFDTNRYVYLTYSAYGRGGMTTHLGRGVLDGDTLRDFELLYAATPYSGGGRHFGSRIVFDDDGYLFMTMGDRGRRERAQQLDNHHGKLLRLHDDGGIPADNPFVDDEGAEPAIYSYGHRNAQGMTLHPETRVLWLHEHGPRGGDEINLPRPGLNFGWPEATFGTEYHGPEIAPDPPVAGMEPPIHHWTPSIAPSGMAFYYADAFPEWQGDLFVGALAHRHLERLRLDGTDVVEQERLLQGLGWRIRDVRVGPKGHLYVLPDRSSTPLLRLRPAD